MPVIIINVSFHLVPGYISRSVAGSYDNEGIAIFALMFTYYLWVSALCFLFFQRIFCIMIIYLMCHFKVIWIIIIRYFCSSEIALTYDFHLYYALYYDFFLSFSERVVIFSWFLFQIKSVKTGSMFWSIFTALSYFYMVSNVRTILTGA